jgi:hypothetical protein
MISNATRIELLDLVERYVRAAEDRCDAENRTADEIVCARARKARSAAFWDVVDALHAVTRPARSPRVVETSRARKSA